MYRAAIRRHSYSFDNNGCRDAHYNDAYHVKGDPHQARYPQGPLCVGSILRNCGEQYAYRIEEANECVRGDLYLVDVTDTRYQIAKNAMYFVQLMYLRITVRINYRMTEKGVHA